MFITFEGIEGSGKSTQAKLCAEYLSFHGQSCVLTREPGATPVGKVLRSLILDPQTQFHHPLTEVLLFVADRLEHVQHVVQPALATGKIVIADRYNDSTLAYQVGGRQLSPTLIDPLSRLIKLEPDLTFLLDLDPKEGLKRAAARSALDRFEHEELAFHDRVRAHYLELAKRHPNRIQLLEVGGLDADAVFKKVVELLQKNQVLERKKE